jgi:hypothetical protein
LAAAAVIRNEKELAGVVQPDAGSRRSVYRPCTVPPGTTPGVAEGEGEGEGPPEPPPQVEKTNAAAPAAVTRNTRHDLERTNVGRSAVVTLATS